LDASRGGVRPVLIVQNNVGNYHSPTVIVAILTSKAKKKMPTHIKIDSGEGNLSVDSTILLEQLRTIDKNRLEKYVGSISSKKMNEVNRAILISLGIQSA